MTDWRQLAGCAVQVWCDNEMVDQGVVEAVTPDGRVLWLTQSGPIERRMVVKEHGNGIRIRLTN